MDYNVNSNTQISIFASTLQKVEDYKMLVKFRLNALVVFSAVMAYLLAVENSVSWTAIVLLSCGGFLVTGAANALNQVLERDYDKLMKRTANRPLATGRMSVSEAVLAAGLMSLFGIMMLSLFNPLTGLLGTISLISYAFIYTPMKRVSPIAVLIGAIPGALPTAIGCVAVDGHLTPLSLALFGIQFFWQFPHFWAIAWVAHEDYTKAGFFLLPSKSGERDASVGLQSLLYTLALFPVVTVPYFFGATGILSLIGMLLLTAVYAFYSWKLYRDCTREAARKLMFASFFYLPLALAMLLMDKI